MNYDYRVRQTSEYVFWNHFYNGHILNLSLVDLLFSVQCKKIQKVKRTIQHIQINYGKYNGSSKRESNHSLLITIFIIRISSTLFNL